MTQAVIGASGEMGKNLLVPLLQKLGPVLTANKGDSMDNVWKADVIWLAVPREAIPELLKGVQLKPEQVVIDICSIKRNLSKVIEATGGTHLSLHPLHGPYVPLQGQKWAVISTTSDAQEHPHARRIISFLKDQGIHFLDAVSQDQHDFMIGIVLSMPELLTIVIDSLIETYAQHNNQKPPSMAMIMEWAVPASNSLFSFYIHSVNSSADWLRRDLILGSHGNMLESASRALKKLSSLTPSDIEHYLSLQRTYVQALPLEERKRVRQWIERWFVDSTQKVFSFHRKIAIKPKLTIQEIKDAAAMLPTGQGKVSVGIHGIQGCFTEESLLRLCEELKIDQSNLDLKYLVESEKVIDAVIKGQVDRGVFAVANSGSGAYISSMHAMGAAQFDIVAIYGMEIMQCLMAHPSVHSVDEITTVFGHPQAVSQCKRTFEERYPLIKLEAGQDSDDTALCAKRIAEGDLPATTATLASQIAAKHYGLTILEYGMHHDPFNTTTFLIIKKKG